MMTDSPRSRGFEKAILDNLGTSVLLFDGGLRLTYINPAGEILLAASARHVLGRKASQLLSCPNHQVEPLFRQALVTGHPFTEREVNITVADGRGITVNCTVLPLQHFEASSELLMELHQVDRQLRIAREEHLISQHQATQALLRGLAHEIKNPLGGLRGAAQLLEQELPERSLHEYTRIIIDEADRLQGLMDRMLGPNRIPREESVNIHHVLEHVRGLLSAESPAGPRIDRDYDPSIPDLKADPDRLIQALLNIVRNAVAAAGQNGHILLRSRVMRQLTIGQRRHRLVIRVEVEDNGEGIPPELQERMFFPLVTGRPGGTGLGLPIAQQLINQHGGLIECESQPGKTRFFIYLPLEPCDEKSA